VARHQPKILRGENGYTGSHNWGNLVQPVFETYDRVLTVHEKIARLQEEAQKRVEPLNTWLKNFSDTLGFKIEIIPADVKASESTLRKVFSKTASVNGDPDLINDHLRAAIIVPDGKKGIQNLETVINTLIDHPDTKAYKDKFWGPNPQTGHRAFMAIIEINGMNVEIKVEYGGMKEAYDCSQAIRTLERRLYQDEMELGTRCISSQDPRRAKKLGDMVGVTERTIKRLRDVRRAAHEESAEECGLNSLLSPQEAALRSYKRSSNTTCLQDAFSRATDGARWLTRAILGIQKRLSSASVPSAPQLP